MSTPTPSGPSAGLSAPAAGSGVLPRHRLLIVDPPTQNPYDLVIERHRDDPLRRAVVVVSDPLAASVARHKLARERCDRVDVVTLAELKADQVPLDGAVVVVDALNPHQRPPRLDREMLLRLLNRAHEVVLATPTPTRAPDPLPAMPGFEAAGHFAAHYGIPTSDA